MFLPNPALALRNWRRFLKEDGKVGFSWSVAQDPAWAPAMAAVDAHMPKGTPGFEAWVRRPPFNDISALTEVLAQIGYADVVTVTSDIITVYAAPEEWWAACLSAAPYAVAWRYIPELDAARDDAFKVLPPPGPDGTRKRTLKFGFTLVRKG